MDLKKITIIERDRNWGLANNIIDGVTRIVNEYGKVIVFEDNYKKHLEFASKDWGKYVSNKILILM